MEELEELEWRIGQKQGNSKIKLCSKSNQLVVHYNHRHHFHCIIQKTFFLGGGAPHKFNLIFSNTSINTVELESLQTDSSVTDVLCNN